MEKLFKNPGAELVFESGFGIRLKTSQGLAPIVKQPLTTPQIVAAFAEIVPDDLKPGFPSEGATQFHYLAPAGPVSIRFEKNGNAVKVAVTIRSGAGMAEEPHPAPPISSTSPTVSFAAPAPAASPTRPRIVDAQTGDAAQAMKRLLDVMLEKGASDLHLSSENPPMLRLDGDMVPIAGQQELSPEHLKEMLWSIAPPKNKEQWQQSKDTDFAHETSAARFRVNVFEDRKGIGAVLRQIPNTIRTAEEMGLSQPILDLAFLPKGLVLVTGPTGSGKSTTLAALIDFVNRNREDHIITIEDPIEFVHPNKKCLVNQREVGVNTLSFKQALRAALREDPDIVLVGELRDLETIAIAIETAETGHLVFGTLHTNTAPSTVDRIIDQFPTDRQEQIRMMLSESLKGVISQTLCKKIGGGRVAAQEVLLCSGSVSNLIREGKTFQIPSIMQTGRGQGMVTLNDALFDLVKRQIIEPKEAYMKAVAKNEFKGMLERGGFKLNLPTAAAAAA